MTEEEAKKVADVLSYAHQGCSHCAAELAEMLTEKGLGWRFECDEMKYEGCVTAHKIT